MYKISFVIIYTAILIGVSQYLPGWAKALGIIIFFLLFAWVAISDIPLEYEKEEEENGNTSR